MGARALAVLLACLVPLGGLAGCFEKDAGTIEILIAFTDREGYTVPTRGYYENKAEDFQSAPFSVPRILFKRSDGQPDVPALAPTNNLFDVPTVQGQEISLGKVEAASGRIDELTVVTIPFNATLANGTLETVDVSFEPPFTWGYRTRKALNVTAGSENVYVLTFMLTHGTSANRTDYFMMMIPEDTGPRG